MLLALLTMAAVFLAFGVWWAMEDAGSWWGWLALALLLGGFLVAFVGYDLTEHQQERQLRRPPLLGDWATRHMADIRFTATGRRGTMMALIRR